MVCSDRENGFLIYNSIYLHKSMFSLHKEGKCRLYRSACKETKDRRSTGERSSSKLGHMSSKTRSLCQIIEKTTSCSKLGHVGTGYNNSGCNEEPQRNPGFPATDRSVAIAYSTNGDTTAGLSTGASRSVALEYSTLGNTMAASIRLDDDDQEMRDDDQEMRDEQQEMKDKHLG